MASFKSICSSLAVVLLLICLVQIASGAPKSGQKYFSFNLSKQLQKNATASSHRFHTDLDVGSDRASLTPLVESARQLLTQFLAVADVAAPFNGATPEVDPSSSSDSSSNSGPIVVDQQ